MKRNKKSIVQVRDAVEKIKFGEMREKDKGIHKQQKISEIAESRCNKKI